MESPVAQAPRYLAVGFDVALVARHVLHDGGFYARAEGARACGVDHGGDGTCAVGGHDVEGSRDHAAVGDLGERGAALGHGVGEHGHSVLALAVGLAEAVSGDVCLAEDGGVGLGDLILACAGDDAALDTNGGAVAAGITLNDGDLAVGSDEGGCYRADEESGEAHVDR